MLVTGARGGVGGTAVAILADRGYEVWAATGKPDEAERLRDAGRGRDPGPRRGDRRGQAARIGTVGRGGRRGRRGDAARTCCAPCAPAPRSRPRGNAGGAKLETTVFPFILRGVALLGMDSVNMAIERRRELWDRLATDLRPRDLGRARDRGHPRYARRGARWDRRRGRSRALDRSDRGVERYVSSPLSCASARWSGRRMSSAG